MGDRAGVRMVLAGSIPSAEAIEALANAVVSENGKPDWNEARFDDAWFLSHLLDAIEQGEQLTFVAEDKLGASMDEVEHACRTHGIAYEAHGDRGADWDSFVRSWQPGMEKPSTVSGECEPSVPLTRVRELLAGGTEGIQRLRALVDGTLGPEFPAKLDASLETKAALKALVDHHYGPEDADEPASAPAP